jgi:hypothetical protein
MTKDKLLERMDPTWSVFSYSDNIPNFILEWQLSGNSNDFSIYPHWNCEDTGDNLVIFSLKDKTLVDFNLTNEFKSKTTQIR